MRTLERAEPDLETMTNPATVHDQIRMSRKSPTPIPRTLAPSPPSCSISNSGMLGRPFSGVDFAH